MSRRSEIIYKTSRTTSWSEIKIWKRELEDADVKKEDSVDAVANQTEAKEQNTKENCMLQRRHRNIKLELEAALPIKGLKRRHMRRETSETTKYTE